MDYSNLPIVFDPNSQCLPSTNLIVKPCKYKAWYLQPKVELTINDYENYRDKRKTIDCLDYCYKQPQCKATVITQIQANDANYCKYYKHDDDFIPEDAKQVSSFNAMTYEIICCKINVAQMHFNKFIFYQPTKHFCKTIDNDVENCKVKIWHAEEKRIVMPDDDFREFKNFKSDCLEKCGDGCFAVSVDFLLNTCLIQNENQHIEFYEESVWTTTFSLKCCEINPLLDSFSDSSEYKNLPIVYDLERDCVPQVINELRTCPFKAWLFTDNLKLIENEIDGKFMETSLCLHQCSKMSFCLAVTISKKNGQCFNLVTTNHQTEKNSANKNNDYKSYILKCCELKKKDLSREKQHGLPIIFMPQDDCYSSDDFLCQQEALWLMEENLSLEDIQPYLKMKDNNTNDCLNECKNNQKCSAVLVNNVDESTSECQLTKLHVIDLISKRPSNRVLYRKICCKINHISLWKYQDFNLMMFYEPSKFCKSVLTIIPKDCNIIIWHAEDGYRMKGHNSVLPLKSIQYCLNECSDRKECFGVSIDFSLGRCLFFIETEFYSQHYGQSKWTTYTKKCCQL